VGISRFHPLRKRKDEVGSPEDDLMQRALNWGVVAAEVEERDDEIIVRLEAPGLEPGDFDINVMDGMLAVSGEKRIHSRAMSRHRVSKPVIDAVY